jgi:hypothetical protein
MSNPENIDPGAAQSMDDIFGVRKVDLEHDDSFKALEEVQNAFEHKETVAETSRPAGFQRKTPKTQGVSVDSAAPQQEVVTEDKVTPERLAALEDAIRTLKAGQNGVRMRSAPVKPAPLDFTKLTESDVFDLDIPIEAVDHSVPEYLIVNLKDKNYVARWVHKAPRRLGPMKANGWTFITKEDLEDETIIEFAMDENGLYRYDDVIAMKCQKQKYFGQLRKNHERALAQVNPKLLHQKAKNAVEGALKQAPAGGKQGKSYQDYVNAGQLEVYEPLSQK